MDEKREHFTAVTLIRKGFGSYVKAVRFLLYVTISLFIPTIL